MQWASALVLRILIISIWIPILSIAQVAKEVYGVEYQFLFGNAVQQERLRRFIALL